MLAQSQGREGAHVVQLANVRKCGNGDILTDNEDVDVWQLAYVFAPLFCLTCLIVLHSLFISFVLFATFSVARPVARLRG
jgi:hypothetical protein